MPASQAQLGYGSQLCRRAANLTTSGVAAITGSQTPQAVTPTSMTSIAVATVLAIDTGAVMGIGANDQEFTEVTAVSTTFTAIIQNNHAAEVQLAIMVPVIEIIKIGGPTMKRDMKEVSNMASPNEYKEFIAGLGDGGSVTFEGNYIPKEATLSQQTLRTDFENGTLSTWCINLSGPVGDGIWGFNAFVQDLSPAYPVDDRITFTGTLKITGKPILF